MKKKKENVPPLGSVEGKMSAPQIVHAAIPVTMAPNANKGAFLFSALLDTSFSSICEGGVGELTRWFNARSSGVGIVSGENRGNVLEGWSEEMMCSF